MQTPQMLNIYVNNRQTVLLPVQLFLKTSKKEDAKLSGVLW